MFCPVLETSCAHCCHGYNHGDDMLRDQVIQNRCLSLRGKLSWSNLSTGSDCFWAVAWKTKLFVENVLTLRSKIDWDEEQHSGSYDNQNFFFFLSFRSCPACLDPQGIQLNKYTEFHHSDNCFLKSFVWMYPSWIIRLSDCVGLQFITYNALENNFVCERPTLAVKIKLYWFSLGNWAEMNTPVTCQYYYPLSIQVK